MITKSSIEQITINNRLINYTLRKSHGARRLRLAVYCDGELVVTKPSFLPMYFVENFIQEKAKWILKKLDYYKKFPRSLSAPKNPAEYLLLKEKAYELINRRLLYFNEFYKFKYKAIHVRNQKTRWGSCSRYGNLSFNYRLISLSSKAADYVIVHELCHLCEFNHSPRFWKQVARTLPDYAQRRRMLKGDIL